MLETMNNQSRLGLSETDDASKRTERSKSGGIQVVADANDRTFENLGGLFPSLVCWDILDQLNQTLDEAL